MQNYFVCPAGSAKAGQTYPGAAIVDCGSQVGQTLPNLTLLGGAVMNFSSTAVEDSTDQLADSTSLLTLFCSGYRYAFIDVSTVWCPFSGDQANSMVSLYQKWLNAGGTVFSVLEQGADSDESATSTDLTKWIETHGVSYSISVDSDQDMDNLIGNAQTSSQAFPQDLIVDLSIMQVVWGANGSSNENFQTYCDILGIGDSCFH